VWKIASIEGNRAVLPQFLRFCLTGGLGTITNLVIFFLCADKAGFPAAPVSVLCFVIAATQNYIVNEKWTFNTGVKRKLSPRRWGAFVSSSLAGLAVNLVVMEAVLYFFTLPYKFIAQAIGILFGLALNYVLSKKLVFKHK
jgi:putative flippase GtrA